MVWNVRFLSRWFDRRLPGGTRKYSANGEWTKLLPSNWFRRVSWLVHPHGNWSRVINFHLVELLDENLSRQFHLHFHLDDLPGWSAARFSRSESGDAEESTMGTNRRWTVQRERERDPFEGDHRHIVETRGDKKRAFQRKSRLKQKTKKIVRSFRFFLNVRVRHLITTDRVFSWSSVKEHPGGPEGRQKARGWISLTDQKRADHSILLHSRSSSFAPTGEIDQSETTLRSTPIEGSSSTLWQRNTSSSLRQFLGAVERHLQLHGKQTSTDNRVWKNAGYFRWCSAFSDGDWEKKISRWHFDRIRIDQLRPFLFEQMIFLVGDRRSVSCPWIDWGICSRDELWSRTSSPLSAPQEEWCQT